MANIAYIQNALNRIMGNGEREFLLEEKPVAVEENEIKALIPVCLASFQGYQGQNVEKTQPEFAWNYEKSVSAAVSCD